MRHCNHDHNRYIDPLTAGVAYTRVFIFYWHIKYHLLNMVMIKCDINQQYLKTVDRHFVKSEYFSLTWSCGSRQRDTILSGWKFRLNNLAVKGLIMSMLKYADISYLCFLWSGLNIVYTISIGDIRLILIFIVFCNNFFCVIFALVEACRFITRSDKHVS